MLAEVQNFKDNKVLKSNSDYEMYAAVYFPYQDVVQQRTPIAKITAETEQILWHQRMGHIGDH